MPRFVRIVIFMVLVSKYYDEIILFSIQIPYIVHKISKIRYFLCRTRVKTENRAWIVCLMI